MNLLQVLKDFPTVNYHVINRTVRFYWYLDLSVSTSEGFSLLKRNLYLCNNSC